jgi:hypothetical protein
VGSTIPLTGALSGSASSGNAVYVYQTNIIRPLRVVSCRRYNFAASLDTTMGDMMSRLDYRNLPEQIHAWRPHHDVSTIPRGGANTQGVLSVWPAPSDATNAIKMTWWRPVQDFTSAATRQIFRRNGALR